MVPASMRSFPAGDVTVMETGGEAEASAVVP
jgi:hypothetical protein